MFRRFSSIPHPSRKYSRDAADASDRELMKDIDSEEFRGLTAFRRHLHSIAEISGHEEQTATLLQETLVGLVPDHLNYEVLGRIPKEIPRIVVD